MSPLLRALVLEILAAPIDYDETVLRSHRFALILDEGRTLDARPLHVPLPRGKCRRTVCATLLHEPGRREKLEEWLDIVGASSGTLARLFARKTGMRSVDWRHQARLADALVRLARGQDVASVSGGLGYERASAFTAMLRKAPRFPISSVRRSAF